MHSIFKFLSKNIISIIAVVYCVVYLVVTAPNLQTAFAIACAIYIAWRSHTICITEQKDYL